MAAGDAGLSAPLIGGGAPGTSPLHTTQLVEEKWSTAAAAGTLQRPAAAPPAASATRWWILFTFCALSLIQARHRGCFAGRGPSVLKIRYIPAARGGCILVNATFRQTV